MDFKKSTNSFKRKKGKSYLIIYYTIVFFANFLINEKNYYAK